ncbi:MAG: ABC transporter substrate-binding protein [Rubellimicrobium sp.]|nr:ABC transporter substrate-binding protein [Rubellimicrobium sp.]
MTAITRRALALALAFGLAPGLAAADDPAPLRIVTSFSIDSMNPWEDGFWMQEFGQAELLMQFRDDGLHHPWLLAGLENPEPTRWVMELRPDVTFQNGNPVDADAILAAIAAAREMSSSARAEVPEDAVFAQTGPLEITVTTDQPWAELPGVLADEQIFLILDMDTVEAAGDDWASLTTAGINTGPYQVTALTEDAMLAEAYAGYWQGTPALPGVEVRFVPDANARILAVQNDEADLALYPPLAAMPAVQATPGLHFNLGVPSTGGYVGYMNVSHGALEDVAVRRAVLRAVDYHEIAHDVFRDAVGEATSFYAQGFPWTLENYRTDHDEAARLLDDAGWITGADGMRSRDGQALSITLAIYPQQPDLVPLATVLQAQLATVGITADVVSFDGINDALMNPANAWDLALLSNSPAGWGKVQGFLASYVAPGARRNFGGYDNPEVAQIIADLPHVTDADERIALLHRFQEIQQEDDPYVFSLTISKGRVVVNDRYECYQPGFTIFHVSWQTAPCR